MLRGTASECLKPGQGQAQGQIESPQIKKRRVTDEHFGGGGASTVETLGSSSSSLSPPDVNLRSSAADEIARLRSSLDRLERIVSKPPPPASPSTHGDPVHSSRIALILAAESNSPANRARWSQLRLLLPPLRDTNKLLGYMFTEAYWLVANFDARATVLAWKMAYETEAISAVLAIEICVLCSMASLILIENRMNVYALTDLGLSLVSCAHDLRTELPGRNDPHHIRGVRALHLLSQFSRCASRMDRLRQYGQEAMQAAEGTGLYDESHISWIGLTEAQIDLRRSVAWDLANSSRWMHLFTRFPLPSYIVNFSVGRPSYSTLGETPLPEDWPGLAGAPRGRSSSGSPYTNGTTETPVDGTSAWRVTDARERAQSRLSTSISVGISTLLPRIVVNLNASEASMANESQHHRLPDLARECLSIVDDLRRWRYEILPSYGLREPRGSDLGSSSAEAVLAVQSLLLHHALRLYQSAVVRPWAVFYDKRDGAAFPDVALSDLEAAGVEAARASIATVPLIRSLQSNGTAPFYAQWVTASLYHSATTLALPFLRATRTHSPDPKTAHEIIEVAETLARLNTPHAQQAQRLLRNLVTRDADAAEGLTLLAGKCNDLDDCTGTGTGSGAGAGAGQAEDVDLLSYPNIGRANMGGSGGGNASGSAFAGIPEAAMEVMALDTKIFDDLVDLDPALWSTLLEGRTLPTVST